MGARKKARRENKKGVNKTPEVPVWADDARKDSEEEQLEQFLFGESSLKQKLKANGLAEDSTGLENVADSDVSYSLILAGSEPHAFKAFLLRQRWPRK